MPARLQDLARVLRAFDVTITDGGGRHAYRANRPGHRVFPVPAHKGWKTEVDDKYIHSLCRNFGLDEAELWSALRGK